MSDTAPAARDGKQLATMDGATVTLRGCVEQIISNRGPDGNAAADIVQLVIDDAEPLYRELRIRNPFRDANGNVLTLRADSEIEITIRTRTKK